MNMKMGWTLTLAVLLAAAGCDALGPDTGDRVVGILHMSESAASDASGLALSVTDDEPGDWRRDALSAPDTVDAGVPFAATVTTTGLNGCWNEAGANVEESGNRIDITPFDRTGAGLCTQEIVSLPREITLRFDEAGTGVIRVSGRRIFADDLERSEPIELERTVVVR